MSVEINWFIEGQVLLVRFSGILNDKSIRQLIECRKSLELTNNVGPIHTILDFRQINNFDLGIGQLNQLIGNLPRFCDSGYMVGVMDVSNSLFLAVQFVTRIAMYQVGLEFQMCSTLEKAINFLQTVERALQDDFAIVS